jgi:hypothetical protein
VSAGPAPARCFGALAMEAVRNRMIELGWGRKSINLHVSRIKSLFKWAVAKELVPAAVHHALLAVAGLRAGRSAARETDPVRPVPEAFVEATLPHANRHGSLLVQMRLTLVNATKCARGLEPENLL